MKSRLKTRFGAKSLLVSAALMLVTVAALLPFQDYVAYWKSLVSTTVVIFILYTFIGKKASTFITYMLVLISVTVVVFAVYIFKPKTMDHLNRFDYVRGHNCYLKNISAEFSFRGGDLSTCPSVDVTREKKRIRFRTDSLGFRNSDEYRGQEYVLVGDSFIVGVADEDKTIPAQLKREYGVDAYSIAWPGHLLEYTRYIKSFRMNHPRAKFLLFVFEGNDFEGFDESDKTELLCRANMDESHRIGSRSLWSRKVLTAYKSIQGRIQLVLRMVSAAIKRHKVGTSIACEKKVDVFNVGGMKVAFLDQYVVVAKRDTCNLPPTVRKEYELLRGNIEHVFFIPEKYRVYHEYIKGYSDRPLPDAQLNCAKDLAKAAGADFTDLTPELKMKAAQELEQGRLIYWADDTHLNATGNSVVAKKTAEYVKTKRR